MNKTMFSRVYVRVNAIFDEDGFVVPKQLIWEDDTVYEIDGILDIKHAASFKTGGNGERFTIKICGHRRYLYFERIPDVSGNHIGRWYVEAARSA